jgi:hypothetical protein
VRDPLPKPPQSPNDLAQYAGTLLRRLWITKGIRFDSCRRYEAKQRASNLAISVLSVYVIAFALIELLVRSLSPDSIRLFPLITIVVPVLILVLSQYESAKGYLVHAERMRMSAQHIERLHGNLELHIANGTPSYDVLKAILETYEEIIRDATANHDNVDYFYFQALHPNNFHERNWWERLKTGVRGRVMRLLDIWALPILVTIPPAILLHHPIQMLLHTHVAN